MKLLSRGGSWKAITSDVFTARSGQHVKIAHTQGFQDITWHGPGFGGDTNGGAVPCSPGEWPEGDPDVFYAFTWNAPAAHGEAHYIARSQPYRFTWFENKGTKSARVGAGKRVGVKFWLRSPGGCSVTPVIWRGNLEMPVEYRTFPEISMQLWEGVDQVLPPNVVTPVTFALNLPEMPPCDVGPTSYLGFGLDFRHQYGPTVHMGPYALYEIDRGEKDIQPIPSVNYWDEVLACSVP